MKGKTFISANKLRRMEFLRCQKFRGNLQIYNFSCFFSFQIKFESYLAANVVL